MATLTPKLTLVGKADDFGDAINLAVTVSGGLTVAQPYVGFSKTAAAANGGSLVEIKPTGSANQYLYVKHTGKQSDGSTATTNQLGVYFTGVDTDTDTNTIESLRLAANEWAFMPVKSNVVAKVLSSSSHTIQVEYAYFTAG